jgi:hypothetical protein
VFLHRSGDDHFCPPDPCWWQHRPGEWLKEMLDAPRRSEALLFVGHLLEVLRAADLVAAPMSRSLLPAYRSCGRVSPHDDGTQTLPFVLKILLTPLHLRQLLKLERA